MKKIAIILILCLPFFSCKKNAPTEVDNNNTGETTSTVETIGSSGGTIELGDFGISVPSNSFQTSATIKVYQSESVCGDEAASTAYKVEGIPEDFSGELSVKLKLNKEISSKAYLAVITDSVFTRGNKISTVTDYILSNIQSGYLTTSINSKSGIFGRSELNKTSGSFYNLIFQASDNDEIYSSANHFKIVFPSKLKTQAQQLAGYLEDSFTKMQSLGFSFSYNYPFKVHIKKFGQNESDVFGKYSHTLLNGEIEEINQNMLSGSEDFKATAAHEFFHFVQDKYDMRSTALKGSFAPQTLWLDEATAVWFESQVLNNGSYISPARLENELSPYTGMHTAPATFSANGADENGYGLSAMIKYLALNYGNTIVNQVYNKIKNGSHPVEAIFLSAPDPISYWWDNFLNQYALGGISTDMTLNKLVKNGFIERWTIEHSVDTAYTFNSASKDLSGKLFDIKLNYDLFTADNNLGIKLNAPDYCNLRVYAYKDQASSKDIKLMSSNSNSFTVQDIKGLKENGYNILCLVTNSQIKSPYTNSTNIKLELSLKKQEIERSAFDLTGIKYVAVHADVEGLFEDADGNQWLQKTIHKISNKNYNATPLTLTSNSVDFFVPASDSISISIKVDTATGIILNLHAAIKYFGYDRVILDGANIPFYQMVTYNGKQIGYACAIVNKCDEINYFRWDSVRYPKFINLICEGGNAPMIFVYFLTERPSWL